MSSLAPGLRQTKVLLPGDVALAERGKRLETLLGSCVAVLLTDLRRTFGAMCHIVYAGPAAPDEHANTAYAEAALDHMYALLRSRGLNPGQCEAYVYGGGNMFPEHFAQEHVGERNARWVLAALAHDGVPVLHQDICGNAYRRVSWSVGSDLPQVVVVPV